MCARGSGALLNQKVRTFSQCGAWETFVFCGLICYLGTVPYHITSVIDPDPNPQDQHVFGPPGSRPVSQRSGSFPFLKRC
jgi:hypothetical protein